jgi:lysophospholipase L1-like esterase
MTRWALAAGMAVAGLWATGAAAEWQCRASREMLELGNPLEIAKTAVAEERELRVVALGSSSTQGYGASNPQFAYPAQLKMRLDKALPGIHVHVWNKGVGGQDAAEMIERMRADVIPEHAHIVVWQVGTNSAIRRDPITKFAEKLRTGIDIGHSLGANFIMMNLQYVPAVVALPDEEEYAQVMADVAKEKQVGLFRRFEIMRSWYNDGMPYAQFVINDGLHLNDFGQKCIAKLLSQSILGAVDPRQLTGTPKSSH